MYAISEIMHWFIGQQMYLRFVYIAKPTDRHENCPLDWKQNSARTFVNRPLATCNEFIFWKFKFPESGKRVNLPGREEEKLCKFPISWTMIMPHNSENLLANLHIKEIYRYADCIFSADAAAC